MTYRKISASLFFLHICKTYVRNPSKASNLLFPEKSGILFYETPSSDLRRFFVLLCFCPPFSVFLFFFLRESIVSRTHRRLLLRLWGVSLLLQSYFSPLFLRKKKKGTITAKWHRKKGIGSRFGIICRRREKYGKGK